MSKRYIDKFYVWISFLITSWAWLIPYIGGSIYCGGLYIYSAEGIEPPVGFCKVNDNIWTAITTSLTETYSTYDLFIYSLLILSISVLIECIFNMYSKEGFYPFAKKNTLLGVIAVRLIQIPIIMFVITIAAHG